MANFANFEAAGLLLEGDAEEAELAVLAAPPRPNHRPARPGRQRLVALACSHKIATILTPFWHLRWQEGPHDAAIYMAL